MVTCPCSTPPPPTPAKPNGPAPQIQRGRVIPGAPLEVLGVGDGLAAATAAFAAAWEEWVAA